MVRFVEQISYGLNYKLVLHAVADDDFNTQNLSQTINEGIKAITKLDVVILYFNSHGYKSVDDNDNFPRLAVGADFISSFRIHEQLCRIDHRLLLTLIDACSEFRELDSQDSFLLKTTFNQANDKIMDELSSSKLTNYNYRGYLNREIRHTDKAMY